MKNCKKIFLLFLSCIGFYAMANSRSLTTQSTIADTIPVTDSSDLKIYEKVEIEAAFPGGVKAWREFLEINLRAATPVYNGAPAGKYTIVMQFVVDKEGNISNIKPLTNHGYGMEAEVLRVLKKGPKWSPAIQDGRPVNAFRKQPVTFQIMNESKKN